MPHRPTISDLLAGDTRDPGCAKGFEVIDQYVELELDGEDAATRFPGLAAHLRSCPACRADHEGLLGAVEAERRRSA